MTINTWSCFLTGWSIGSLAKTNLSSWYKPNLTLSKGPFLVAYHDPGHSPFDSAYTPCARSMSSHHAQAGYLQPLPILHHPWSHISVDFSTGSPPSQSNIVILNIVDWFSKSVHYVSLAKLVSATESADPLVQHVFQLHSIPLDIVFDCSPQWTH